MEELLSGLALWEGDGPGADLAPCAQSWARVIPLQWPAHVLHWSPLRSNAAQIKNASLRCWPVIFSNKMVASGTVIQHSQQGTSTGPNPPLFFRTLQVARGFAGHFEWCHLVGRALYRTTVYTEKTSDQHWLDIDPTQKCRMDVKSMSIRRSSLIGLISKKMKLDACVTLCDEHQ